MIHFLPRLRVPQTLRSPLETTQKVPVTPPAPPDYLTIRSNFNNFDPRATSSPFPDRYSQFLLTHDFTRTSPLRPTAQPPLTSNPAGCIRLSVKRHTLSSPSAPYPLGTQSPGPRNRLNRAFRHNPHHLCCRLASLGLPVRQARLSLRWTSAHSLTSESRCVCLCIHPSSCSRPSDQSLDFRERVSRCKLR